jgi:hypothetical protein
MYACQHSRKPAEIPGIRKAIRKNSEDMRDAAIRKGDSLLGYVMVRRAD